MCNRGVGRKCRHPPATLTAQAASPSIARLVALTLLLNSADHGGRGAAAGAAAGRRSGRGPAHRALDTC